MKKIYFKSIKSACFMLFACLTLSICATSCSSDEFETNLPEEQKQLSKADLIERALSKLPQTRAAEPYPIVMVATKKTVSISCLATESVIIHWTDDEMTTVPTNDYSTHTYTYADNELEHLIYLETSSKAITRFSVYQDGLIFLDVTNNTNLSDLFCVNNDLEELDLTGCPNLEVLWASANKLSFIDLTHLSRLRSLCLDINQFADIDLSRNLELEVLVIGNNPITNLDLTKNMALQQISIAGLPIDTINNAPINSRSFVVFPQLAVLDVSRTSFTSLDFSDNPLINEIYIEGTAITQLDISNLQIARLNVSYSQLTKLTYTLNNLKPNCHYVNIIGSPFENVRSNIFSLASSLPDRKGEMIQGQLYTTSTYINSYIGMLAGKGWVVYLE